MAIAVEMPKMSDTMEEGVLVEWSVEEGAAVSAGDVIAQVETDKATMDLEVYDDGVLLKKVIEAGEAVPIGGLIAVLGKEGEDPGEVLSQYDGGDGGDGAASEAPPADEASTAEAAAEPTSGDGATSEADAPEAAEGKTDGRLKASPLARRLAKEHNVNLAGVSGSGPEGRIVKRDIEAFIGDVPAAAAEAQPARKVTPAPAPPARPASAPAPVAHAQEGYEAIRITQMRKAISRRLSESKFTSPHFYLNVDIDMQNADAFRKQVNQLTEQQGRSKVSFNDLITKACALALRQHPMVNASYLEAEGEIRQHHGVHVAVAVAMEEGLITPVVRNADQKGLAQISAETRELAGRARNRQLQPDEYQGSTFTTSNLGMFGIESFTAIINPPNACILAIGAIRDVPVVQDGAVVPGKRMKLTLSCDHRVVDGALGAQFLATVRQFLENPLNMML